jgi:hypothetical protein
MIRKKKERIMSSCPLATRGCRLATAYRATVVGKKWMSTPRCTSSSSRVACRHDGTRQPPAGVQDPARRHRPATTVRFPAQRSPSHPTIHGPSAAGRRRPVQDFSSGTTVRSTARAPPRRQQTRRRRPH